MSRAIWDWAVGLDLVLLVAGAAWRSFTGGCIYDRSRARALSQDVVEVAVAGLIGLAVIHGVLRS